MAFDLDIQQRIEEDFIEVLDFIQRMLQQELAAQGHVLTRKLLNSIQYEVKRFGLRMSGKFFAEDYGIYLDRFLPPGRVPYRRGSGARKSKLIEALEKYFIRRGFRRKTARGYAFATAQAWKREGRPTMASRRFSTARNNRRTGWITDTLLEGENKILKGLEDAFFKSIAFAFDNSLERLNEEFKLAA